MAHRLRMCARNHACTIHICEWRGDKPPQPSSHPYAIITFGMGGATAMRRHQMTIRTQTKRARVCATMYYIIVYGMLYTHTELKSGFIVYAPNVYVCLSLLFAAMIVQCCSLRCADPISSSCHQTTMLPVQHCRYEFDSVCVCVLGTYNYITRAVFSRAPDDVTVVVDRTHSICMVIVWGVVVAMWTVFLSLYWRRIRIKSAIQK